MTSGTAITLDIPVSIYLISLTYFAKTRLQAKGVTIWLLAALTLGIASFAIAEVFVLTYSKVLIDASSTNLVSAYESYIRILYVYAWSNLITLMCSDVVHWVFAMQYWTLACKL